MAVNWSSYLNKAFFHIGLDTVYGVPHQAAALLTWVDSVGAENQPVFRFDIDHPGEYSATPTNVVSLPDFGHRYVVNSSDVHVPGAKMNYHAKIGGVWAVNTVTQRAPWTAGDLAVVVVIASEAALDAMVVARSHLPLMRKYVDQNLPDDPVYAPSEPFTAAQVGIIGTWFNDLGTNGNTKYPSGLTNVQVANFFGQYVPEITSPATMSAWMQANPRHQSIAVLAQVFEFAP